jgi:hypothetical protein
MFSEALVEPVAFNRQLLSFAHPWEEGHLDLCDLALKNPYLSS